MRQSGSRRSRGERAGRQFGIPADEAERICSLDLPDVDLVDTLAR
ncbi:hypothetical protein [Streptomyces sp. NPDC001450]